MNAAPPMTVLAEVFQIEPSAIPVLTAYQLDIQSGDMATIGGKLAFRLQKTYAGHWLWSHPWIVTDTPQTNEAIKSVVEILWQEQPRIFHGLHSVQPTSTWQPTAQVKADFVARSLWTTLKPTITQQLASWSRTVGSSVQIHRICEVRGWVVQEQPAISVSIDSRLIATLDVQAYARRLSDPHDLIGLMVADKASTMKGTITRIMGTVAQHRERLLMVATMEQSKAFIRQAADNELVVKVHAGHDNSYDYVARALHIIVRTADYTKFRVDAKQATQALRLSPEVRSDMIGKIAAVAKARRLVSTNAYSSRTTPTVFLTAQAVNFLPSLVVGEGQRMDVRGDRDVYQHLCRFGFYQRSADFPMDKPVQIGILNALPQISPDQFLQGLQGELRTLKFASQITHIETVRETSRSCLEQAIHRLTTNNTSIILALFPDGENTASGMRRTGGCMTTSNRSQSGEICPVKLSPTRRCTTAMPSAILPWACSVNLAIFPMCWPNLFPMQTSSSGLISLAGRKNALLGV